jgi:hypothetical protein
MKKDTVIGISILIGALIVFSFFIGFEWIIRILLISVDIVTIGLIIGIIRSLKSGFLTKASKIYFLLGLLLSLTGSVLGHMFIKFTILNSQTLIILGVMAVVFAFVKLK